MDNFREQVKRGFQACKDDINHMSSQQSQLNSGLIALEQENKLLQEQIRELRNLIFNLQDTIDLLQKSQNLKNPQSSQDQLNSEILTNKSFSNSSEQNLYNNNLFTNSSNDSLDIFAKSSINLNQNRPNILENSHTNQVINNNRNYINSNSNHTIPLNPHEALKEFKYKSNKKEILKEKIIEMIGERGMFLNELKFMFVDCYKYTSKATFYNYLKEIELEKSIRIERVNNKNMVLLEVHTKEELIRKNRV